MREVFSRLSRETIMQSPKYTEECLQAHYGTTLFFTTHSLQEAQRYGDRIAIMYLDKMAALGVCKELETSLGGGHTLNEFLVHYADNTLDSQLTLPKAM